MFNTVSSKKIWNACLWLPMPRVFESFMTRIKMLLGFLQMQSVLRAAWPLLKSWRILFISCHVRQLMHQRGSWLSKCYQKFLSPVCINTAPLAFILNICNTILPEKTHFTWWYQVCMSKENLRGTRRSSILFTTNIAENNYLKPLLFNWQTSLVTCLWIWTEYVKESRWPFTLSFSLI